LSYLENCSIINTKYYFRFENSFLNET